MCDKKIDALGNPIVRTGEEAPATSRTPVTRPTALRPSMTHRRIPVSGTRYNRCTRREARATSRTPLTARLASFYHEVLCFDHCPCVIQYPSTSGTTGAAPTTSRTPVTKLTALRHSIIYYSEFYWQTASSGAAEEHTSASQIQNQTGSSRKAHLSIVDRKI